MPRVTEDEYDAALKTVECLREELMNDGMEHEADVVNEAHYLLQEFEELVRE